MIIISVPIPPSVNHMYKPNRHGRGRRLLTDEAAAYKAEVALKAANAAQLQGERVAGQRVAVHVSLYGFDYTRDIDNVSKALLDGLSDGLGFDDRYVEALNIARMPSDGEAPHCWVVIDALGPAKKRRSRKDTAL